MQILRDEVEEEAKRLGICGRSTVFAELVDQASSDADENHEKTRPFQPCWREVQVVAFSSPANFALSVVDGEPFSLEYVHEIFAFFLKLHMRKSSLRTVPSSYVIFISDVRFFSIRNITNPVRLPRALNLNGMPVLALISGQYHRAVILSHPVKDGVEHVSVRPNETCPVLFFFSFPRSSTWLVS